MSITAGSTARADDFINKAQRNATPSADAGRVVKLESDGYAEADFILKKETYKAFEAFDGSTTPQAMMKFGANNVMKASKTLGLFSGFSRENQSALAVLPSFLNGQTADIPTGATTFSVTANAGNNRVLVVFLWYYQTMTVPTGLTWNGIALTKQTDLTFGAGSHMMTWTAPIGNSGSNQTFNVTITGGSTAGTNVRDHSSLIYDSTNQTTVFTHLDSAGSASTSVSTLGLLSSIGVTRMLVGSSYGTNAITGTGFTSRTAGASTRSGDSLGMSGQIFSTTKATSECALVAIALNPVTTGQDVVVITDGIIDGFTGLTANSEYYLDTTNGAISASGTGQKIGIAISTTRLRIYPSQRTASGIANASTRVQCGFRPKRIKAYGGETLSTSVEKIGFGLFQNGQYVNIWNNRSSNTTQIGTAAIVNSDSGSATVTSVDATGFNFVSTGGIAWAWEAEE